MSEDLQPIDSEKEQIPRQTAEEKHLQLIQSQTETAKNPSRYETYEYHLYKNAKLFAARTRGQSHIDQKTPCQDFCSVTSINGCFVLADADGVGSCEHSDMGSRFACEAVFQAVESASRIEKGKEKLEEDEFVNRILSVSFREKLLQIWIGMVKKEIKKQHESMLTPEEQLKEFNKYGSTIMFAVISENWIVAGNLGDGQILVFNDSYGIKLRVHPPKDSSKVRCLVNERCVREDFQLAKYPRKFFNGVLLTTDGIYESFDKGIYFYDLAVQMKQRFLEKSEPYQAFCYKEEGEPYKDFSVMRTYDDCSMAMFVDEKPVGTDYENILSVVKQHSTSAILKRWSEENLLFFVKNGDVYGDITVAKQHFNDLGEPVDASIPLEDLKAAVAEMPIEIDMPTEIWTENNYVFSSYTEKNNAFTVEYMHCAGLLRRDKKNPEASSQKILKLYCLIKKLQAILKNSGYELNSSALFNLSFDDEKLYVRREAVEKIDENRTIADRNGVDRCFDHIVGVLKSEKGEIQPVFNIGYLNFGVKYCRKEAADKEYIEKFMDLTAKSNDVPILLPDGKQLLLKIEGQIIAPLMQLIRESENNRLQLKNVSDYCWITDDDRKLNPGDSIDLPEEISFVICNNQGEKLDRYTYISKSRGGFYDCW